MTGVVEHFLRCALLDDPAFVHEHDAIGDLPREANLMGNHHHGHAAIRQLSYDGQNLTHDFRIERRCRLIEKHQPRRDRESASDRDTLLLSSRQTMRHVVCMVREADGVEKAHA